MQPEDTLTYSRLVGFGEAMVRLASPVGTPLVAATTLEATVGGAELNALVAATVFGMPSRWVTALPRDTPVADLVRRRAAAAGIAITDTGGHGGRVGLYFLDRQPSPRPGVVHYDRAGSAFAALDPAALDWSTLLDDESCLVVSGITPAVSGSARTAMFDAVDAAVASGATIALDVNYRPSLWSSEECYRVLGELLPHVDLLSAGDDDLAAFGAPAGADRCAQAAALGVTTLLTRDKRFDGPMVDLDVTVADATGAVTTSRRAPVVDPVGAGDAAFGAVLAVLPSGSATDAAAAAADAAATCYGLHGDFLEGTVWTATDRTGGVLR